MENEKIKKIVCDLAVCDFNIEHIFWEIFVFTYQRSILQSKDTVFDCFDYYCAIYLKYNYDLFIDEILYKGSNIKINIEEFLSFTNTNKICVDNYFVTFVNHLKKRFFYDQSSRDFFKIFHRRDIKQESILRAFISVRTKLRDIYCEDRKTFFRISLIYGDPFKKEKPKIILKIFHNLYLFNNENIYPHEVDKIIKLNNNNLIVEFSDAIDHIEDDSSKQELILLSKDQYIIFTHENNLDLSVSHTLPYTYQKNYFQV